MLNKIIINILSVCLLYSFAFESANAADKKNKAGLEKAFQTYIRAAQKSDVETMKSMMADTLMYTDVAAPTGYAISKEKRAGDLEDAYKDTEKYSMRIGISESFLAGNTGVVYGLRGVITDRKHGLPPRYYDERFMMVFSYINGRWLLVNETNDALGIAGFNEKI